MKTTNTTTSGPQPKPEPMYSCTVLIAGTEIGEVKKGKNARVRLPKSIAETLAGMKPPRVRINGV